MCRIAIRYYLYTSVQCIPLYKANGCKANPLVWKHKFNCNNLPKRKQKYSGDDHAERQPCHAHSREVKEREDNDDIRHRRRFRFRDQEFVLECIYTSKNVTMNCEERPDQPENPVEKANFISRLLFW